jgi:cyanophycinase-like exopeptidase
MHTRVILHGGNSSKQSEGNKKFFREILDGIDSETEIVRILCVYFARPQHRWEDSYAGDRSIFCAAAIDAGRKIVTTLATYNTDDFRSNIAESDVIFINGGMKGRLKEMLLTVGLESFRRMVEGKTLVGISAGANLLSKYYYSSVVDGVREGTGFMNIKLLTHYSKDKPEQLNDLRVYGEDIPVIAVAEEEYFIVE